MNIGLRSPFVLLVIQDHPRRWPSVILDPNAGKTKYLGMQATSPASIAWSLPTQGLARPISRWHARASSPWDFQTQGLGVLRLYRITKPPIHRSAYITRLQPSGDCIYSPPFPSAKHQQCLSFISVEVIHE